MNSYPKQPQVKFKSRKFNEQTIGQAQNNLKKQTPYKGILGNGKTSERIKFTMWNVNGIRSVLNKNAIHNFINQYRPDIICINQTKINKELFDKSPIQFKGYSGYWNFCKISAGYSGVAIFSKFLPLSISQDLEEAAYSQEGRVLTLQFEHFYLVAVYIPSAGDKKLQRLHYKTQKYEKAFHKYCENLKQKGKGVIVCGDFNVCHEEIDIHFTPFAYKQPGFTPEERKSFSNLIKLGWIDTFRKLNPTLKQYTWWRIQHGNRQRNIGKRLDYFLVNQSFFPVVEKSEILGQVKGSDHCPILLIVDLKRLKQDKKEVSKSQQKIEIKQDVQVKEVAQSMPESKEQISKAEQGDNLQKIDSSKQETKFVDSQKPPQQIKQNQAGNGQLKQTKQFQTSS